MQFLSLGAILCSVLVFAESAVNADVVCGPGRTRERVTLKAGSVVSFSTQSGLEYGKRVSCAVIYKRAKRNDCKLSISCSKFNLAENNSPECKGRGADYMFVNRERFCNTEGPDVTMKGSKLKVGFKSSGKSEGGEGANCTVSCLASGPQSTVTPGPAANCTCGLAQRSFRIVGGQETEVNEYPWQVGIVNRNKNSVWCGGSLISAQWILTASHCVVNSKAKQIQVLLGEHNVDSTTEAKVVRMDIAQIVGHAHYDHWSTDYDFALLKMKKAVDFGTNPHIRPVCLPRTDGNDYVDYIATTTGWGTLESSGGSPDSLQEVDVKVTTNSFCNASYTKYPITDQMLCANAESGEGGKDACQGDSGGPLVTKEEASDGVTAGQNYELIGVVSWGIGCGEKEYPGVYARVSSVLDWININSDASINSCPRT